MLISTVDAHSETRRFSGSDQLDVATDSILADTRFHPRLIEFIASLDGKKQTNERTV